MTSEQSRVFSEIIDRQIELQEMEAAHDTLVRNRSDPDALRASQAKIRAASAGLAILKAKAGLRQTTFVPNVE